MSYHRNWNLNEREGRYAKTAIREPAIYLRFGLKRVDGSRKASLADRGFVTRREIEGRPVFDV
jgi:hypothetical protein